MKNKIFLVSTVTLYLSFIYPLPSFATSAIDSARWNISSESAYNNCGLLGLRFFGFFCEMTVGAVANKSSTRLRSNLIIYDTKGNEIDSFIVKKIYFDPIDNRCRITPQPIRKFTTYFTVYECKRN